MAEIIETSLEQTVKKLLQSTRAKVTTSENFTIFRASTFVSDNNKELYAPQMVPIGPYHRDDTITCYMEKYKHQFLRDFLDRNAQIGVEVYIQEIRALKERAIQCYSEEIKFSDDEFIKMLLFDGCFILELLFKLEEDEIDSLSRLGWDLMAILSDLLLLENQMPFFILEKLYAIAKGRNGRSNHKVLFDLRSLVTKNFFTKYLLDGIQSIENQVRGPWAETHHLLHLYHQLSLPNLNMTNDDSISKVPRRKTYNVPLVIPSATQLFEYGVNLRRKITPRNIFHVTFNNGTLRIPQLVIDPTRRTLLMNLLAFEKCVIESERTWTGLLVLMNCVMKNKSDLEILQRAGIVLNLFPTEDEAVRFVGQLSERVTIDFNGHCFADMFGLVNLHCDKRTAKYRARFMHDYFKNPWAAISFASSMAAILLSTVQTLVSLFTYRNRFRN